ncbi:MAG: YfhO family protein [Armatimonadetes bacterium]|nr:YfhO family protein [Armatimonadota bacterium]
MLTARTKTLPALLYLLALTLLVYNVALLPGRTFVPADLLLLTPPWRQHAAALLPGFREIQRPALDPLYLIYPPRQFLTDSLRAGRVPLWDPYRFCGIPFAATDQAAAFYPPNWLLSLLSPATAYGWLAALHTFLAGAFFFLYGRRRGWCDAASLCGATVWMLCGVMVAWQMWQTIDAALCWLPLALFFLEGWRATGGRRQAAGLAAALGMSLLAGHLQFAFYVWLTVCAYAVYRLRWSPRLLPLAGVLALGVGIGAAQLLATADLLAHGLRADTPYATLVSQALPVRQLAVLVAPDLLGGMRDWTHHGYVGGAFNYYETTVFCGAAALAFALFGLLGPRQGGRGDAGFWAGLAAFALLMGCGSPLLALFFYGVPLFQAFHGPARILCLLDFAVAVLCAQGVQRLGESAPAERRRLAGRLLVALALLLALGYQAAVMPSYLLTHGWLLYGLGQAGRALLAFALACLVIARAPARLSWLAAPVVAADMLLFAVGVNTGVPARLLFPPTPETEWVSAHLGGFRVLCRGFPGHDRTEMVPNTAMALGWRDVSGYDPLVPARYERLLSALNLGTDGTSAAAAVPAAADAPLLGRLGVRYVIAPYRLTVPGYRLARAGDVNVYEDSWARLAWAARQYQVVPDEAEARRRLLAGLVPSDTVLLNALPSPAPPPVSAPADLRLTSASPEEETIQANLPAGGVLVTDVSAAPGWRLAVDGAGQSPLVADTVFLATALPGGDHRVTLRYRPEPVLLGLYLSLVAWGVIGALLTWRGKTGKTTA